MPEPMIAVVIPCYKVRRHILDVITGIGADVEKIIVVDDACPEQTGAYVQEYCSDRRVEVLFHDVNKGVGGAVITGYRRALEIGASIVVKVDGDGQMDTTRIGDLTEPILLGYADYTKGNRFFEIEDLTAMPTIRLIGNGVLSLMNKLVNGYWDVMDPTNGYTAISATALKRIPLNKLERRYYFESDLLFRLGLNRSVVLDVPMPAIYKDEQSNLSVPKVLFQFPLLSFNRFLKRIVYTYFVRDFHAASIEIVLGLALLSFGVYTGLSFWLTAIEQRVFTSSGSVMLSALPIILGFQLLLSALNFDIQNVPRKKQLSTLKKVVQ